MLNSQAIRDQFPVLARKINGYPLVYMDSAATSLKPAAVVKRISDFYLFESSNVHRGIHTLSQEATANFEAARKKVQVFLNAGRSEEIVFTKGTTEGVNLVAHGLGALLDKNKKEIVVGESEHHSNLVPWQMACEKFGLKIRIAKMNEEGQIPLEAWTKEINEQTALISFATVSNTVGYVESVEKLIQLAKKFDALTFIDAAQSVAHEKIDLQKWDCDFLVFSAHKIYGPTGFGILYGRHSLLVSLPPMMGGGSMIKEVQLEKSTYEEPPLKFEAGTPHIAGAIGLATAIDWLEEIGISDIYKHEMRLINQLKEKLLEFKNVKILGRITHAPLMTLVVPNVHPHDLGTLLDQYGVAVRTGHLCAQPVMRKFGLSSALRLSLGVYNDEHDNQRFLEAFQKSLRLLEG